MAVPYVEKCHCCGREVKSRLECDGCGVLVGEECGTGCSIGIGFRVPGIQKDPPMRFCTQCVSVWMFKLQPYIAEQTKKKNEE